MPFLLDITEHHTKNYAISQRARTRVLKNTFQKIGEKWLEEYLPLHFRADARERYGYAERTVKYKRYKMKKTGGRTDLVYTGLLKRSLLNFSQRINAYPTRVTIKLIGPKYLTINYTEGRPNLGKEVLKVTPGEMNELMLHGHAEMFKFLEAEAARNGKRIRHKAR